MSALARARLLKTSRSQSENVNVLNTAQNAAKWNGKALFVLRLGRSLTIVMEILLCTRARSQGATVVSDLKSADIILVEKDVTREMLVKHIQVGDFGRVCGADWLRKMFISKEFIDPKEYALFTGPEERLERYEQENEFPLASTFPKAFEIHARALVRLCARMESDKRPRVLSERSANEA